MTAVKTDKLKTRQDLGNAFVTETAGFSFVWRKNAVRGPRS